MWERFEIFEAIHHSQRICNPMREDELNHVIGLIGPTGDRTVLDIACGSGELLIRCHELGTERSDGVDLSPWMLQSAARNSEERLERSRPRWHLANGATWRAPEPAYDRVVCLGAEWIWHGMTGTIAALAERVTSCGRIAFGGPRLHHDADPDITTVEFGKLHTADDVENRLTECGFDVVERVDPGEQGWLAYLERGRNDALAWQKMYPGDRAESYLQAQSEWFDSYERDRSVVGWSVWVADRA